jgi:hypothetical protein
VKGRRVSRVTDVRSFFMSSANRWTVWNHPQVTGYFDIIGDDNGPLRPVITRDDFKLTSGRASAFDKLMKRCEQPLLKAIEAQNMQLKDKSMRGLEGEESALQAKPAPGRLQGQACSGAPPNPWRPWTPPLATRWK